MVAAALWGLPVGAHERQGSCQSKLVFVGRRHLPCGVYLTWEARGEPGGADSTELHAVIQEGSRGRCFCALDTKDSGVLSPGYGEQSSARRHLSRRAVLKD